MRVKSLLSAIEYKILLSWLVVSSILGQSVISMAASLLSEKEVVSPDSEDASQNKLNQEKQDGEAISHSANRMRRQSFFGYVMVATDDARLWRGLALPRSLVDNERLMIGDRLESPSGGLALQALDKSLILFGAGGLAELQAMTFSLIEGGQIRIAFKGGSFRIVHGLRAEIDTEKGPLCALLDDTGAIETLRALDISINAFDQAKILDCRFGQALMRESPVDALARMSSVLDRNALTRPRMPLNTNDTARLSPPNPSHNSPARAANMHSWKPPRKLLAAQKQNSLLPLSIASAPKMDHFPKPEMPDYGSTINQSQAGLDFISMIPAEPSSQSADSTSMLKPMIKAQSLRSLEKEMIPTAFSQRDAQLIRGGVRIFRRLASPQRRP